MIKENIERLRNKIAKAASRVGRDPDSITIVGACKHVPPEKIEEAATHGIRIMGENIVQDAIEKCKAVNPPVEWHMIGHLQRNKVKKALPIFSMIQSLDSLRLAEEINKRADKKVPVLLEVNTSGEQTKYGFAPDEVILALRKICELPNIKVSGLMTIGPLDKDPRASFRLLRELQDKIEKENISGVSTQWLSMGMTDDYEIAVEEGSNMVRIGRAIFGERG